MLHWHAHADERAYMWRTQAGVHSVDTLVGSWFWCDHSAHQRCWLSTQSSSSPSINHHKHYPVSKMCLESHPSFPFPIIPQPFLSHCIITVTMLRFPTASSFTPFQLHPHTVTKWTLKHQPSHGSALTAPLTHSRGSHTVSLRTDPVALHCC